MRVGKIGSSGAKMIALGFMALCLAACGQGTMLAVHASASTRTAPDVAVVTLGVLARGGNAREAQAAQTARMNAVMTAARAAGVEDAQVQTVGYSLEPQYAYPRNAAPRITGYVSRNIVAIRVRNLEAVSGLIDATVAEGANELQGIQFTFDNVEASREAARAEALNTARARANAYAEAAEMRVVRMLSITEPGAEASPLLSRRADGYMAPQAVSNEQSAAISPGEIENLADVDVVFELR
jgi:uncharacterized protein YggE